MSLSFLRYLKGSSVSKSFTRWIKVNFIFKGIPWDFKTLVSESIWEKSYRRVKESNSIHWFIDLLIHFPQFALRLNSFKIILNVNRFLHETNTPETPYGKDTHLSINNNIFTMLITEKNVWWNCVGRVRISCTVHFHTSTLTLAHTHIHE